MANKMRAGSIEITMNPITTEKMTKKGTLPRKSISLNPEYLKFETINKPPETVTSIEN